MDRYYNTLEKTLVVVDNYREKDILWDVAHSLLRLSESSGVDPASKAAYLEGVARLMSTAGRIDNKLVHITYIPKF